MTTHGANPIYTPLLKSYVNYLLSFHILLLPSSQLFVTNISGFKAT